MNIQGRDLNLLRLFDLLYRLRSLSAAAKELMISQPALSHRLAKLRHEFDDPLFVRAPRGLTPTPLAHTLAPQIGALMAQLEQFYQQSDASDFLHSQELLRLYTTDYMEQHLLPGLLATLEQQAPKVQLVTHPTTGELPKEALQQGRCDLAIAGFYQDLPQSFYQQALWQDEFVVLADRDNPILAGKMSLQAYLDCPHLVTTLTGDLDGLVDKALRRQNRQRRVVAGLSSFMTPPLMLVNQPFVLTCLASLAQRAVAANPQLAIYPCPIELAPVQIVQIWHERTHRDPLRRWLRAQLKAQAE
ncbi:LysR family transcriptional regulator [Ferrimonas marina]|uniref:Transcriptional regulator, LysR family n=1 Tax=Ferrimonas marina TaxID=299255 RepID=A0A1M5RZQ6_9GAMM|nr:LysR family transcriptional regulator [Ferrimonas marina]SHH31699.1 transcriptional regulator, LysR family [Ferrimonas marina]